MLKRLMSLLNLRKSKKEDKKIDKSNNESNCIPYKQTIEYLSKNLNNLKVINKPPIIDFSDNEKSVVIIDDVSDTYILYKHIIDNLSIHNKGYKFVYYLGKDSGIRFLKDLENNIIKKENVEMLILDITLGDIYHLDSVMLIDGIDIAAVAQKLISKDKIYFLTSHTKNYNSPIMKEYKEKYECLMGNDFESRIFNKAFERKLLLEKLL